MDSYRCYLLDASGTIRHVGTVSGNDDDGARRAARQLLAEHRSLVGFELWHLARRVGVEVEQRDPVPLASW
jgi:hypothetical protein